VVTKDIPPFTVWYGNPARQHGFITESGKLLNDSEILPQTKKMNTIDDIRQIEFPQLGDERGQLVVVEGRKNIPFDIKRIFYMYGSDPNVIRGQHANRRSEFCLINISGTSKIKAIDCNGNQKIFDLDRPHIGVYLPTMIWKDMYDFSLDSVLLVLSNEHYDKDEYIRNYDDFIKGDKK
jgi:dTDP-4-dehydrorhamnose 3,5-epimerase-like enzyme